VHVERVRPTVIRMTLHAYEATALITAARWVAEGAQGDLPDDALEHLREVLANYDDALRRMSAEPPADPEIRH
jgi:hypothetical protein